MVGTEDKTTMTKAQIIDAIIDAAVDKARELGLDVYSNDKRTCLLQVAAKQAYTQECINSLINKLSSGDRS